MKRLFKALDSLNVSKIICVHLIGVQHTRTHRKLCGMCIMVAGISVAHMGSIFPFEVIHIFTETAGAAIHGIGFLPFLEGIEKVN